MTVLQDALKWATDLCRGAAEEFHADFGVEPVYFAMFFALFAQPLGLKCWELAVALRFMRSYDAFFHMNLIGLPRLGRSAATRKAQDVLAKLAPTMRVAFNVSPKPPAWDDFYTNAVVAVDAAHCKVRRRQGAGTAYYSWKFRHDGLGYQIAIDVVTDKIIHWYGPYPASAFDGIVYDKSGLPELLRRSQQYTLADNGYKGKSRVYWMHGGVLSDEQKAHNKLVAALRWKVEVAFSRLKKWAVLGGTWRSHRDKPHAHAFAVAVVLYNLQVEVQPLRKAEAEADD